MTPPDEIRLNILNEQTRKTGGLNLSGTKRDREYRLTHIPDEVFELSHLTSLDVSGNDITEIPNDITKLTNLISLKLSENQLITLPDSLRNLQNLRALSLSANKFSRLPDIVYQLPNLGSLELNGNRDIELPTAPGTLTNLSSLNLAFIGLEKLPSWIATMGELAWLNLDSNLFDRLPQEIFSLTKLSYLSIGSNPLGQIDPRLSELTELRALALENTGLSALPIEMARLSKLTSLYLWGRNHFETIPPVIFELKALNILDFEVLGSTVGGNRITEVPRTILQLPALETLELKGNPITSPPPEIVFKGIGAIRDYFRQVDRTGKDFLYEAKLLIVGEPGAGKTSLMKKILDPTYSLSERERSTEGIATAKWDFDDQNSQKFTVNIWDFGGQEIYHATHQFFLTRRSVYVLLADIRKEDTDFYYWLNIIELLGGGSPVIIVKNEKQDRRRDMDDNRLRMRFPNLVSIRNVNLATNRGLEELIAEIRYRFVQLPHIGTPLPRTWVEVRKTLEADPATIISVAQYLVICDQHGIIADQDKATLLEFFHDLGVCLHFKNDPILKNILILKTKWGTEAVYKVLDSRMVIDNWGEFKRRDLASIWTEPEYRGRDDELLQLMLNFKICYPVPNLVDTFIAPQRLSSNQPQYDWEQSNNLVIRYVYDFLPKGIITQIIVGMHGWIAGPNRVWKKGAVLERDKTLAEITEEYQLREIRVRAHGLHKKEFLTIVNHEMDKIHSNYSELICKQLVPCNCSTCVTDNDPNFYDFAVLRRFLAAGQMLIQCQKSFEMARVTALIDDIHEVLEPEKDAKRDQSGWAFYGPVGSVTIGSGGDAMKDRSEDVTGITSAWANGLFYLLVFVIIFGVLGYFAQALPLYTMALIILGGILLIPLVGAFQLRQDRRLAERSFMDLIKLVIGQLPLLSRFASSRADLVDEKSQTRSGSSGLGRRGVSSRVGRSGNKRKR